MIKEIEKTDVSDCVEVIKESFMTVADAGFTVERLIEESDARTVDSLEKNEKTRKAKMIPLSFVIKAKKCC